MQWRIQGGTPGAAPLMVPIFSFRHTNFMKRRRFGSWHPLYEAGDPLWEILDLLLLWVGVGSCCLSLLVKINPQNGNLLVKTSKCSQLIKWSPIALFALSFGKSWIRLWKPWTENNVSSGGSRILCQNVCIHRWITGHWLEVQNSGGSRIIHSGCWPRMGEANSWHSYVLKICMLKQKNRYSCGHTPPLIGSASALFSFF